MRRLRLLLSEEHEMVRDALRLILETKGNVEIVADVADGEAAIDAATTLEPDVAVLGVGMSGFNGLAATRAIKQHVPNVAVVALTHHAEPVYVQELLAAGASGYVLKQSPFGVLLDAIHAAASGDRFLDPAIPLEEVASADAAPQAAASDREMSVLHLAAAGKSNKDIAAALNIAVKTVEVHKSNAMRKLRLRDRADLTQFAIVNGWMHD
jgi:DNA-binding NarL/FixJ family response regulator